MSNKKKQIQTARVLQTPATTGKKGKTPPLNPDLQENKFEIDYFRFYESLYRKEIIDWQNARVNRHDPFNPVTYPIQQLYKDALLDNHLSGAIENRMLRVLNKQFTLKDKDGNPDIERSALIQTKWFKHLVRKALESKFYGYSCCLLRDVTAGSINRIADIPRENIVPERGIILKNALDPSGEHIAIADFSNFIIYIQLLPDAVGILERIAPITIFKRHSWASWDEFEQIFGVPIRIAKTMIDTKKHKDDLQLWLETMGTSSYGIFDKRVDLEIKENNRSDAHSVFSEKIALLNKEISKGILGQTMTMDDGSSQSQANVHLQTLQEITDADIADVEDWYNDNFIDIMRNVGYDIPQGYYLELVSNTSINPSEKIKIDDILMKNGWNLDKDYIEQTYEVKIDETTPKSEPNKANAPLSYEKGEIPDFFR